MSNQTNEDFAKNLSEQSQVKQTQSKRRLSKTARLSVMVLVLVLSGFAYLTSQRHAHKQSLAPNTKNTENPYTLQENLSVIERMQREAQAQRQQKVTMLKKEPKESSALDAELVTRMNAPTTFVNVSHPLVNKARKNPELATPMLAGQDSNSAFLNAKNGIELVNAVSLPHPDYTIGAGEFISATMETAENSELPGIVRARVSHDVYAITGNRVLIPKGAMLVGQYASGNLAPSQTRFLISWTRVQLPNGIVVTLNSPSADDLGRGGLGADAVDRHFTERFSLGLVYSILGTATATLGVSPGDEYNSRAQYRMNVANSLEQSAHDSLQQNRNIQNTLNKYQGAAIKVTVARDLDFYSVLRNKR
ncbi:TrbI/VirB10 family protein [Legionella saoudiensis]|uniref:TrbI/VirB10 family protein n=1 Tax=Legionella saoudiensis TaxID=1750561 RepID=UPI00073057C0|nr:TrbI/VirB10 family protein [Legionella saoudiensis]